VDAGETVRLVLDGDLIESLSFSSVSGGLTVSVPRYGRLAVAAEDGERLREYDANNIPPVPDGFRP
jgi:hypothetical protein